MKRDIKKLPHFTPKKYLKKFYCSKHQVFHRPATKYASCNITMEVSREAVEKAERSLAKYRETILSVKGGMTKAFKTSQEMCRLRQDLIDKAVLWHEKAREWGASERCAALDSAVMAYIKFKKKNYPKD